MAVFTNKMKKGKGLDTTPELVMDASVYSLGRLAVAVARVLIGKHSPSYAPNRLSQPRVIVYNTDSVRVTGKKGEQKLYWSHSGYPGSLRERTLDEVRGQDSRRLVWQAVWGMLPKNKLRKHRIKNLELYPKELPAAAAKHVQK